MLWNTQARSASRTAFLMLLVYVLNTTPQVASQSCLELPTPTVELCRLSYTTAFFPNDFAATVSVANKSATVKLQMMQVAPEPCKSYMATFLCASHFPPCTAADVETAGFVKPCKSTCEDAYSHCQPLRALAGLSWPPDFECDRVNGKGERVFDNSTTCKASEAPSNRMFHEPQKPSITCPQPLVQSTRPENFVVPGLPCAFPCQALLFAEDRLK
eukprot:Colp12_sorted_trinity150504_noHs@30471